MVTSALTRENLSSVASRASWAFMLMERGDKSKLDDAKNGLQLLELFEHAQAASEKNWESMNDEESDAYRAVRRTFFVERVPYGAPGWQEWNIFIHQAFKTLLNSGIMERVKRAKTIAQEPLEGLEKPQLDEVRELFARLSLSMNEPK